MFEIDGRILGFGILSPEFPEFRPRNFRSNNIAEISHQKTRHQQRQMRQFVSIAQAQRFLSCHGIINNHFRQQRHLLKAKHYRIFRDRAFTQWAEVTCVQNMGIA